MTFQLSFVWCVQLKQHLVIAIPEGGVLAENVVDARHEQSDVAPAGETLLKGHRGFGRELRRRDCWRRRAVGQVGLVKSIFYLETAVTSFYYVINRDYSHMTLACDFASPPAADAAGFIAAALEDFFSLNFSLEDFKLDLDLDFFSYGRGQENSTTAKVKQKP